jgi:hypothetical protein
MILKASFSKIISKYFVTKNSFSSSKFDHWREMARKMGLEFFVTKNSFSSYFHLKNT